MTLSAQDFTRVAGELVAGARRQKHGDAHANHANVAALWTAFLRQSGYMAGDAPGLSPRDVMLMMALLKIARTRTGKHNADDYVDAIGYLALAGATAERLSSARGGSASRRYAWRGGGTCY